MGALATKTGLNLMIEYLDVCNAASEAHRFSLPYKPMIDIPLIARLVQSMVRKALDAFVMHDIDLATSVLASDNTIDTLRTACYNDLTSFMEQEPRNIQEGLALLSI